MEQRKSTITVSSRPPDGMDTDNGREYTRCVTWAMDVWDDAGQSMADAWDRWSNSIESSIRQRLATHGDIKDTPRKHHYVPRFWIKHFAGDDGRVYSFDWDHYGQDKFGGLRYPSGCMVEPDLYNALDRDGKAHATLERARGEMENRLAPQWDVFVKEGKRYVVDNLDFKMLMSEYLARICRTPWFVHRVKSEAHRIVSEKFGNLDSRTWEPDVYALKYLDEDDLVPHIRFMLFARNWIVRRLKFPLALPSVPVITSGLSFVDAPIVSVPLTKRVLLLMCWNTNFELRLRNVTRMLLWHTKTLREPYRKMVISSEDRKHWSQMYSLHKGVGRI